MTSLVFFLFIGVSNDYNFRYTYPIEVKVPQSSLVYTSLYIIHIHFYNNEVIEQPRTDKYTYLKLVKKKGIIYLSLFNNITNKR